MTIEELSNYLATSTNRKDFRKKHQVLQMLGVEFSIAMWGYNVVQIVYQGTSYHIWLNGYRHPVHD